MTYFREKFAMSLVAIVYNDLKINSNPLPAGSTCRTISSFSFRVSLKGPDRAQEPCHIYRICFGPRQFGVEARGIGNIGDQAVEAAAHRP